MLGISEIVRTIYDYGYFSWKRSLNRRFLENQMKQVGDVSGKAIAALLSQLVPLSTSVELVRIGGPSDGGYIVPADYLAVEALFSPGIAGSSAFELAFAERGIPCFLIDASVDGPIEKHNLFDFEKKYLGGQTGEEWITLKDWLDAKTPASDNLGLQMDIEGFEWDVLLQANSQCLARFRFIVVEHHDFHKLARRESFEVMRSALEVLSETHFPVHVHGNNYGLPIRYDGVLVPQVLEVTWVRKGTYVSKGPTRIPHPEDAPNNPRFKDLDVRTFLNQKGDAFA